MCWGCIAMGELAALDHSAVVARFGAPGASCTTSSGAWTGDHCDRVARCSTSPRRWSWSRRWSELEPLRFVLHHLCGTLCEQLAARGAGAARAVLTLTLEQHVANGGAGARAGVPPGACRSRPRRRELLERLLMARLEAAPPPAAVERLALELDGTAPEAGQQLTLFSRQGAHAARLEWQLASLAIRFGDDRILRASTGDVEAPLAERRFDWHDAPDRVVTRLLGQHPAIEVEVDARGWPVGLRWPGVHEPVEACNHWRIEEAWWRRPLVRDYFKVVGPRLLALVYRDGTRRLMAPRAPL